MTRFLLTVLTVATLAAPVLADATASVSLERQRAAQESARRLTRQMIQQLIETNLQQLRENGLAGSPLYEELQAMHKRISELAESEMAGVVQLLSNAMQAAPADRPDLLRRAQEDIQRILTRLLTERERIQLRRQQAELISMVSDLLREQAKVRQTTSDLSGASEESQLAVVGAQRNVLLLYNQFRRVLDASAGWGGPIGRSAIQARRICQARKADAHLDAARQELLNSAFGEAVVAQKAFEAVLEEVLGELRRTTDPLYIQKNPVEAIRRLIADQVKLRESVRTTAAEQDRTADHVRDQADIARRIQELPSVLASDETADKLIRQAAQAADRARLGIFQRDQAGTLDQQAVVIAALTELAERVEKGLTRPAGQATADELTDRVQSLQKLEGALTKALKDQQKVNADAVEKRAEAGKLEAEVAKEIAQAVEKERDLPGEITASVDAAADETKEAADALKDGKTEADEAKESTRQAEKAIRRALGEVRHARAEAEREALALKAGELNRAAEALDRAAAAARRASEETSPGKDLREDDLDRAADDMEIATEIAKNVAEGTKTTSPNAQDPLKKAAEAGEKATDALAKVGPDTEKPESSQGDDPAQPTESKRPEAGTPQSDASRKDGSQQAAEMAKQLETAAAEIRKQLAATANDLEKKVETDLAKATDVGQKIGDMLNDAPANPQKLADEAKNMMADSPAVASAVEKAAEAASTPPANDQAAEPKSGQPEAGQPPEGQTPSSSSEAPQSGTPETAQTGTSEEFLQRGRVLNDIEKEDLKEQLELARRMQDAAKALQDTPGRIEEANQDLTDAGAKPGEPLPSTSEAAQAAGELADAMTDHAQAMNEVGNAAANIAGQSELANQPVREATNLAAGLQPTPIPTPESADGQPGEPDQTASAESGEPQPGEPAPSDPGGMMPGEPMATSQMMAGQNAQLAAQAMQAKAQPQPGQPQVAMSEASKDSSAPRAGDTRENAERKDGFEKDQSNQGDEGAQGGRGQDETAQGGPARQKAWFTSLPPAAKQAMQTDETIEMPRGYEKRLRAYFGSTDE